MCNPSDFQRFDRVRYTPRHAATEGEAEDGVVTGNSESYVFVRFNGELQSKACRPGDLTLLKRFEEWTDQ